MEDNLERAIENLREAERLVSHAAELLENEGNNMTPKNSDDTNRQLDLRTSAEACRSEIARKIVRRRMFLVSVRDGYT